MFTFYFNRLRKILVLSLIILSQYTFGQNWPKVYEANVIPSAPRVQDTVKVGVWIMASGGGRWLSYGMAISGDTIDIYACIALGVHSAVIDYKDTFTVGQLPEGQYHLRVTAIGSSEHSYCEPIDSNIYTQNFDVSPYNVGTTERDLKTPLNIELAPNPASGQQILQLQTSARESCDIRLYDPTGREVRSIFTGQLPPGKHRLTAELAGLPTGIYFYRVRMESEIRTIRTLKN